ncbi:thermonuclease family protein [Neobacillus kokaensis]|uniref:SPBc2 prophage-derived endonuclease YokF n=1 Tax=Neobacillus kokaensis TaxID=2759023 RepID=A0ABQ3N864_9BACI|nr:thermonuclease family protein [Neobacillus kokaensis]GHI00908.1 SPBc2 prophage-derived endonuclease YokF [Neobacillus kokaensis]
MRNKLQFSILFFVFILGVIITGCTSTDPASNNTNKDVSNHAAPPVEQKTVGPKDSLNSEHSTNVSETDKRLIPAVIVKNIDGDTVEVKINNRVEKLRMLCVDTPETHHPRLGVQPFGPEASEYTKKILSVGEKVEIEPGIGDGRDKYGRLLGYIYIDGKMFNKMLLEKGLARIAYVYAPNTKYVDEFYAVQKEAQKKGVGIWSIENYAQEDGYHSSTVNSDQQSPSRSNNKSEGSFQNNPGDDQENNLACKGKIKGNANSHIYHVPGGSYYESAKDNIVWFCSEKDAQDAGYRKSKR